MILRFCLIGILYCCFNVCIIAQNNNPSGQQELDAEDPIGIEINGLIIDKTRTKMGRDFYQLFYTKWEAPPAKTDYIITISEQPSRGRGSQVFVHVNDYLTFRAFLQPSQQFIAGASEQATNRIQNFIKQLDKMQENFGNEDLQGSGIY